MVYVLTVVAAFVVAGGEVIQQRMAARAPPEDNLSPKLLLWLVRRPRWLAGVGCSLAGNSAFATALGMGSVVLIEAVFVSRLLFGLVIAALWGWHRVPARDLLGGAVVVIGIATFLVVARPTTPEAGTVHVDWWLGAAGPVAVASLLAVVASRFSGAPRAAMLGAGAGIIFGLQAVLVQAAVHVLADDGVLGLLQTWNGYVVVGVALFGMLLVQSAFESAPLPSSYPAVVTAQLLCAFALGVWVLHGEVRATAPWIFGLVPAMLLMVGGIGMLTRSPLVTGYRPTRQPVEQE
jgi:hypothetical protein